MEPVAPQVQVAPRKRIDPIAVASVGPRSEPKAVFTTALHPPGVKPASAAMAQDDALGGTLGWAGSELGFGYGGFGDLESFIGYPALAEMAQRPEYRKITETIATEMTRRWIEVQAANTEEDKTDKIQAINAAMDRLSVRQVFHKAAEHDGFFGGGHVYIDLGNVSADEMQKAIGDGGDDASRAKIGKGDLKALRNVEPVWCYPQGYNSTDPMAPGWYEPSRWIVMSRPVHATRLLTFVGRSVPDILKPAYSFRGLSMSQMARPYIDNWLRTRQSVSDIIEAFSVFVLKTNMDDVLAGGAGDNLDARLMLFNATRTNRGTLAIDKEEDFQNISAPLGGLDALQAQAQEQMASVSGVPLVKLLGITPSGLNASSDGEIRVFYDWILAYQEHLFRRNLTTVFNLVQLSEFGEIDPALTFKFVPLWSMSEKELADVRKTEAETDGILVQEGIILPSEARARVAGDPDTPYVGLDPDLEVDPPDPGELDPVPDPTLQAGSE